MDFLKNNLFYVILVAAVLLISIPSYLLAASRNEKVTKAVNIANGRLGTIKSAVGLLKPVSPEAIQAAKEYKESWKKQVDTVLEKLAESDQYLETTLLVAPPAGRPLPMGEEYKAAYNAAFDGLMQQLVDARLCEKGPKMPLAALKVPFGDVVPNDKQIRITQKEYLILKEVVDALTSEECHVTRVESILLDARPGVEGGSSTPNDLKNPANSLFWTYPMQLEFQIDFRYLPEFLKKLVSNEKVTFVPDGYRISRAIDERETTYTPFVAVKMYCIVWDYLSTDYEKQSLADYAAKKPGRRR